MLEIPYGKHEDDQEYDIWNKHGYNDMRPDNSHWHYSSDKFPYVMIAGRDHADSPICPSQGSGPSCEGENSPNENLPHPKGGPSQLGDAETRGRRP